MTPLQILFIHQNFSGQFKHLAPALACRSHKVVATTMKKTDVNKWRGIDLISYSVHRGTTPGVHPWAADIEPYRGYHIFMRALPEILQKNPEARVLIIGGWGERPAGGFF